MGAGDDDEWTSMVDRRPLSADRSGSTLKEVLQFP